VYLCAVLLNSAAFYYYIPKILSFCSYSGDVGMFHIRLFEITDVYRVIKRLCAPDDYSTKNPQIYFKQFQSLTMIT
jgi:hypothetical protein